MIIIAEVDSSRENHTMGVWLQRFGENTLVWTASEGCNAEVVLKLDLI